MVGPNCLGLSKIDGWFLTVTHLPRLSEPQSCLWRRRTQVEDESDPSEQSSKPNDIATKRDYINQLYREIKKTKFISQSCWQIYIRDFITSLYI